MSLLAGAMVCIVASGDIDEPLWLKVGILGLGIVALLAAIVALLRQRSTTGNSGQ